MELFSISLLKVSSNSDNCAELYVFEKCSFLFYDWLHISRIFCFRVMPNNLVKQLNMENKKIDDLRKLNYNIATY